MNRFGFVILFAWVVLTYFILDSAPAPVAWTEWAPDYCRTANCYCEPIRDRWVAQPLATYSNLGIVLVGMVIVWATIRRPPSATHLLGRHKLYGLVYGLSLIGVGLFSFFYHASLTRIGDYADLMGMYLFTTFLMLYTLARLHPLSGAAFAFAYLALNIALGLGLLFAYRLQQVYLGLLVAVTLATEFWIWRTRHPRLQLRYFAWALTCFSLGAGIWILDRRGGLPCNPAAPFTWHALWHLSVALAAGLLYLYYRSEEAAEGV